MDFKNDCPDLGLGRALDVGCRFGEFSVRLFETMPKGSLIIGIDISQKAVETARKKHPESGYEFEVMDAAHLDFDDDSFELVAISNTLHHIEYFDVVLSEMKRVLKPGGYFLINEMFSDAQTDAQEVHLAQHTFEGELDTITGVFHGATYTRGEIQHIFEKLGLRDITYREYLEEEIYDEKLAQKNATLIETVEKKLSGRPEYDDMKKKAEYIQGMCKERGIKRCTQLLCVGRK